MGNDYKYSDKGMELTKSFEGLRLEAYPDSTGIWTVGYGHTGAAVVAGVRINEAEAEAWLREDLAEAVACVNRAVKVAVSQSAFDAMVDFCFNAGRGSFLGSTLLRKVNEGDFAGAAGQFGPWVHAGGAVVAGLVKRRKAEAEIFVAG